MSTILIQFLSKFNAFTQSEAEELASLLNVKEIKKDTLIVRQGEICTQCFFVLKGCLRQFINNDGNEKTIAFYTEEEAVNFFTSITHQKPSESSLNTIEDSVVLIGDPGKDQELFAKFPVLEKITKQMIEQDFGKTQDAFAVFMTSSPEERYLNVLNQRPDLIQRVPQHQLASYLGITPESLSRIRKRIIK